MRAALVLCSLAISSIITQFFASAEINDASLRELERILQERVLEDEVATLKNVVAELSRQALLTQLQIEEKTRNDGDSGIKQVRHGNEGTETYFSDSHLGGHSAYSMHNHANNIRTIGLGEFAAVLNGVEFRTRHNDYGLRKPSSNRDWQATEDIPFPDVPPEVLAKATLQEQIEEMREWFKAFRDQSRNPRDYRDYFKPVLCYMEGFWTQATDAVDESFESDRHFIDAASWFELQDKIRYQAYSGAKDSGENLAYLPRIVINVTEDGLPVFAQWNYDILCHPISGDVPLNRFRVVDDIHGRMRNRDSLAAYESKRFARFKLNAKAAPFTEELQERNEYLDKLMYQIPGKDNYGRTLRDDGPLGDEPKMRPDNTAAELNAAKYHRTTFVPNADAMGRQLRFRGYADANIWMAMTTQDKVAGMSMTNCKWVRNADGNGGSRQCTTVDQKWTYAIPLEIIYMTPLSSWNPYNLEYKGDNKSSPEYQSVTADNRNGASADRAFNGVNSKNYYITPAEFYDGSSAEIDRDPADTTPAGGVWVDDPQGNPKLVRSSGYRIFIPEIHGIGPIRQRYPIAPIVAEGNTIYKELEAVKEFVMDPMSHGHLMYNPITNAGGSEAVGDLVFQMKTRPSNAETQGHVHHYTLYSHQIKDLRDGKNVTVTTGQANAHVHTFLLYSENGSISRIKYYTCDDRNWCSDGHPRMQEEVEEF